MLLQLIMAGSFILALLALLMFIWPRRDALRALFGVHAAGNVGDHGNLTHSGGCNGDGGSGDC